MPDAPPRLVTTASTTSPSLPGGATQVSVVGEVTTGLAQVWAPRVAVAPAMKLLPMMVTVLPPSGVPLAGLTALTVGVGFT